MRELTNILRAVSGNSSLVSSDLLPLVYEELRTLAKKQMSDEPADHTLQATALVHEAWLHLSGNEERSWDDRTHFFRTAAQAMRRILVDRARAKSTLKRGQRVELLDIQVHGLEVQGKTMDEQVLLVDEMMTRLEQDEPDSARVVSLKYFGGLTNKEIADMDGVAERTVDRRWAYAKARLFKMIREENRE